MSSTSHCRHPGCRCDGRPELDGYCSNACAGEGSFRNPTGSCTCGHPACSRVGAK
jgi:hypothetical protein